MRRCAPLTYCTAFGRTHRSWCLFVWLFTSGMRSVGGFRRFDVERLKRPRHLRSRSDQSRRKLESALAHSASHKDEIHPRAPQAERRRCKPSSETSSRPPTPGCVLSFDFQTTRISGPRAGEILPTGTEHRNPHDRESDCLERIDAGFGKL